MIVKVFCLLRKQKSETLTLPEGRKWDSIKLHGNTINDNQMILLIVISRFSVYILSESKSIEYLLSMVLNPMKLNQSENPHWPMGVKMNGTGHHHGCK